MKETKKAEEIINKYLLIISSECEHDSYCKSPNCKIFNQTHCLVDIKKAKNCAKTEVQAIIDLPIFRSEEGTPVAKDNGIESTLEFWESVLLKIDNCK
jgi:hypothetical protein